MADAPAHDYAILKAAEERQGGHPGFEVPTLYRALRRMREVGLVRSLGDQGGDDGERRQYWQATSLGRAVLAAEIDRLEALVAVGKRVVAESA